MSGERGRLPLRLAVAVIVMGVTALTAQVVLTRELLTLFYGNELSIALVLAVWLVGVAGGSASGAKLAPRIREPVRAFGISQVAMAVVLPVSLLIVRKVQPAALASGELPGPGAMLAASAEALFLVCALDGVQFVVAARAAGTVDSGSSGETAPVARVYALEAAGSVLGGVLFHFYLSQHALPLAAVAGLGAANVISGWALLRPRAPMTAAASALGVGLVVLIGWSQPLGLALLRASPRWSRLNVVAFHPSKYSALVVTERAGQVSVFQSGVVLFTSQDEYENEATAHLAMLETGEPRRVLLIGGAVSGLAGEVLKHGVERLDCVELDPRVVELARRWLPAELLRPLDDPRVRVHYGDGRRFVRDAEPGLYDTIIVNVPDPTTAALNRFYTVEFLREAQRALAPDGIMSLSLTGSAHHLSGPVQRAAASLDATISVAFPERLLVPGERMFFLAAEREAALTRDWEVLARRLDERGLDAAFVNEVWLRDALLPFRRDVVRQSIESVEDARINTDLNPISYHHQTRIWLQQLSPGLARPMRALAAVEVWWGWVLVGLAGLIALGVRGRGRRMVAVFAGVAVLGAFGLCAEVLGLLAFQSACGYLYHALGALMATFMAGLSAGAGIMSGRWMDKRAAARLFAAALAVSAIICALLPGMLGAIVPTPAVAAAGVGVILFLVGSLVGAAFPIGTELSRRGEAAPAGGGIYAADLVGSAGAAVFAGAIAVPALGMAGTARLTGLVVAAALVLVLPLLWRSEDQG